MTPGRFANSSALLLAVLGFCSSCGGSGIPDGPSRLTVYQVFDRSHALYIEGSLSYIRLEGAHGAAVERQLDDTNHSEFHLKPGHYRLLSWQRACSGNCSNLDPPMDRCSITFDATAETPLHATIRVRPGEGCRIIVGNGQF